MSVGSAIAVAGPVVRAVLPSLLAAIEGLVRAGDAEDVAAIRAAIEDLRGRLATVRSPGQVIDDVLAERLGAAASSSAATATPGERAWTAYRAARGGKNHDGTPTPTWAELTDGVREGWEAAAAAVRA